MSQPMKAQVAAAQERDELIERARAFAVWLDKGKEFRAFGHNIAFIRKHWPQPFKFDEYELRRAIEEGLI